MGLELKTQAIIKKKNEVGKLHLDSKHLTFKGSTLDWSVDLGPSVKASADGEWLVVSDGRQTASFRIEEKIDAWIRKILNPPTRITKLGVKSGWKFWISKGFAPSILTELVGAGAKRTHQQGRCDIAFLSVTGSGDLNLVVSLSDSLPGGCHLWIVWPKANSSIRQGDVLDAMRALGIGPSKTAAFDAAHSSMRFTMPRTG